MIKLSNMKKNDCLINRKCLFRNPESPQRRTPAARAASFNRKKTEVREEEENITKCQEQQASLLHIFK